MMEGNEKAAIIRMFHVFKRFGKKNALVDITLDIFKNEFVFICGPSGAGKSTLLKLLYLGETLSEGQILIEGVNISRKKKKKIPLLRREFGIVFQDFKLIPTKTVFENVALVLEAKGKKSRKKKKKVKSVLRIVGLFQPMLSLTFWINFIPGVQPLLWRRTMRACRIRLTDESFICEKDIWKH